VARSDPTPFNVRVWDMRTRRGRRGITYVVRWQVAGRAHQRTFATRKLADAFRSSVTVAAREGLPFDQKHGLPVTLMDASSQLTWYEHACAFTDLKWDHISARHRKGLAEALTTVTCALVTGPGRGVPPAEVRAALTGWAFNKSARGGMPLPHAQDPPEQWVPALRWIARQSEPLTRLTDPQVLRRGLDAISTTLRGQPASSATIRRKRSAFYSALGYAVELDLLPTNPLDKLRWSAPAHTDLVDRRVVVNPDQARALLNEVARIRPSLEAFFACIYFAAMRPSEVRHLRVQDCILPESGWGTLLLAGSTQEAGRAWTDSGEGNEDRELKHRAARQVRPVPASPELVASLRRHLAAFPPGTGGRLFVTRTGRAGVPLAAPYSKPIAMGVVYRTWAAARRGALSEAEEASPLARRPYDLRHAAVSLWLNAGVPATQVAEWAGHSVNVLLRVYASCVSGQEGPATTRIEQALGPAEPSL
jgi:integrase